MWCCVIVWVVPSILKDHSAFIFTFKQSKNMQRITVVQNVKNYPPNEAVSTPKALRLEERLLSCGNANVSRMLLSAECQWSSDVFPWAPSCWRAETGKWEAGSWLNAIAVAQLEPDRCPASPEIHPLCYSLHKQRNMIQWMVWKWSKWRHVGSNVYWNGHGFGSWNDADLSGEVSLCLSDESLTYSISSTCFMP